MYGEGMFLPPSREKIEKVERVWITDFDFARNQKAKLVVYYNTFRRNFFKGSGVMFWKK
jgi:hypothetical protein